MGVAMAAAALASAASGMTVAAPRKAMAYNKLGSSDLMVSSCCLGTGASSKCPSPRQPMRPPAAPEARPFAPWNPRGEPRHVDALWCPPNSPVSPPHGRAPLLALPECGSCASSGRGCRLWAVRHRGPNQPPPKPPIPPAPPTVSPIPPPFAVRAPCGHPRTRTTYPNPNPNPKQAR